MTDEFDGMPRLAYWMKNAELVADVVIDPPDKKVGWIGALILFHPNHPERNDLFKRIAPMLPRVVVADFQMLFGFPVKDQWVLIEAAINRVRDRAWLSSVKDEILDDKQKSQEYEFPN